MSTSVSCYSGLLLNPRILHLVCRAEHKTSRSPKAQHMGAQVPPHPGGTCRALLGWPGLRCSVLTEMAKWLLLKLVTGQAACATGPFPTPACIFAGKANPLQQSLGVPVTSKPCLTTACFGSSPGAPPPPSQTSSSIHHTRYAQKSISNISLIF